MSEVEIKLSKEEYKTFLKFIYFADYCVSSGLISYFKNTDERNKLFDIISKIYKSGDKLDIPKSFSLTSIASEVRFSEEESLKLKHSVESDLDNISKIIFAQELAKRDLKPVLLDENVHTLHTETHSEINQRWIYKAAQKYLREFKKNGISNLRFKMFYNLTNEEDES